VSYVLRALCTTDKKITRCAEMTFLGNAVAGPPIAMYSIARDAAQAVDIQGGIALPQRRWLTPCCHCSGCDGPNRIIVPPLPSRSTPNSNCLFESLVVSDLTGMGIAIDRALHSVWPEFPKNIPSPPLYGSLPRSQPCAPALEVTRRWPSPVLPNHVGAP
jgi:hypothetical protein